ncbi:MAG: DUF5683 domain-containing protein [Bacteroidales bacterium]|jgi:hypothetical protein|nr:DUF5683 domain-containing protein [Bacteroidales bacterium]
MLLALKSRICFVAVVVLLLSSLEAAGQEPVDSTDVAARAVTDSIAPVVEEPDTMALKFNPEDTESGIIRLSDTTALTQAYPLDSLDTYAGHSPAKAAIMSAVLPGLGQIYNRKYWKVPIVYAAVGISVGVFLKWQNEFSKYRRAYIDINDNDPYTNYFESLGLPSSAALTEKTQFITKRKDQLRTWRDWSIVAVVAAYALNIIDANVDAHLMDFNLDDNISLNIQPCFLENGFNSQKFGLNLQFTF